MNMQTCNSDKHPDYASVYDGDKHESCPACEGSDESEAMRMVRYHLHSALLAAGVMEGPEPVEPVEQDTSPTEPEETPQPTPIALPPGTVQQTTSDIKEECARLEAQLGSAEMVQVRKQNVRFPSGGTIVTAWRGRRDTAIAYRDALQAVVDKAYSAKMAEDNRAPESKVTIHPSQPASTPLTDGERGAVVQATTKVSPIEEAGRAHRLDAAKRVIFPETIEIPADVTDDDVPF